MTWRPGQAKIMGSSCSCGILLPAQRKAWVLGYLQRRGAFGSQTRMEPEAIFARRQPSCSCPHSRTYVEMSSTADAVDLLT